MIWYSLSVRVSAGATVMESPVCTPIGSRFSIEQMMMQLSFLSRTTSISNSFQPSTRFLDQDFVGGGGVDAALDDLDELGLGVGDAAAGAAHGEGGPDDRGQADVVERAQRVGQVLGLDRARRLQPDPGHGLAETAAILGLVDGVRGGADHLDVEFCQRALLAQRQRAVQRGLAAHGRQQRKAAGNDVAFLLDDLGDDLGRDRLDIGRIGQFRVGHDGGRIGIDQDDAIALFLQRLDRLGAGIIEFAGLADHDRDRRR